MGFDTGRIVLDSSIGTYYAGQIVRAKLIFYQETPKTFRGIYVKVKGYCNVEWTTDHTRTVRNQNNHGILGNRGSRNNRTETYVEHHRAYEVYYEFKQYLIGAESGEYQIEPGNYEFPFDFHIPDSCPSSFEGNHGHIRYELKAVVDRPFQLDQVKKVAIRVIAPYNLNNDPYCREPMQFDFEASYCCWCVSSGSVETIVKLPVSGYCPGQVIPIEVRCDNNSNVEIVSIKFSINKELTFRASDHTTKSKTETVAELKKGPVAGGTKRNWTVEMQVPALDTYNLESCRFIDLNYEFKVYVSPSGCHGGSHQSRPLVIGAIPLVGFQDDVQNPLQDQMPQQQMPVVEQRPSYNPNYPTPPITNQSYPGTTQAYPGGPQPYPSPYPGGPQPYPNVPPYAGGQQPYPIVTSYPSNQANSSYPGVGPYSGTNSNLPPYPGGGAVPPYPYGDGGRAASDPWTPDNDKKGGPGQDNPPPYNPDMFKQ